MPIRYWLLIAALGCLIVAPLAAQEPSLSVDGQQIAQERDTEGETAGEQDAPAELPPPPDLTPAIQGVEAAIRDLVSQQNPPESDEERDRAKRDLEAQEDMANWAAAMFFATIASVLVTAAGVFLVWQTLEATRRAAHYAKLAADHAESAAKAGWEAVEQSKTAANVAHASVKATREIGEAQVRAYLKIESVMSGCSTEGNVVIVNVSCRNTGQSPSADTIIICEFGMACTGGHHYSLRFKFGLPDICSASTEASGIGMPPFYFPIELWQEVEFIDAFVAIFARDVFNSEISTCESFLLKNPKLGAERPIIMDRVTGYYPTGFLEARKLTLRREHLDSGKRFVVLEQQPSQPD